MSVINFITKENGNGEGDYHEPVSTHPVLLPTRPFLKPSLACKHFNKATPPIALEFYFVPYEPCPLQLARCRADARNLLNQLLPAEAEGGTSTPGQGCGRNTSDRHPDVEGRG